MFKIKKTILYTTIPKSFLEDKELSIQAKGLLASLYHSGDIDFLKEDKDYLRPFVKELVAKGYAEVKENDIHILLKTKTRCIKETDDFSMEKKKGKTLYEEMLELISDFKEEEKKVFIEYFNLRVNPRKDSRFASRKLLKYELINLIDDLRNMNGDKVQIIRNSIKHQYFKFIDIKAKDKLKIQKVTQEDKEALRKQKEKLESEGYVSQF